MPAIPSQPSPPPSKTPLRKTRSRSGTATSLKQQPVYDEEMIKPFLYHNAVECPICFLYYPQNINHSRCCDQPVCTECFLQIKRHDDSLSEPATCPFCLEDNFGVVYTPPSWSEARTANTTSRVRVSPTMETRHGSYEGMDMPQQQQAPRRKSIKHTSAEVVLVDHVRPDWQSPRQRQPVEATTAAVVPRRNSDTRSGLFRTRRSTRPHRSASAAVPPHLPLDTVYQQQIGHGMDFDVEEYLIMEAVRLSLQDQEDLRRRNTNNRDASATNVAPAPSDTDQPNANEDPPVLPGQQPSSTPPSTVHPPFPS
ncbi:hypothetical protein BX666DRAFT_394915 [Dichotomocladium elegans]|nr:hypothetical protein BX666DRAFT_394915 [Dichotomocladium elegans]